MIGEDKRCVFEFDSPYGIMRVYVIAESRKKAADRARKILDLDDGTLILRQAWEYAAYPRIIDQTK